MNELSEFQQRAASLAVVKLLNGDTFYTTDVKNIADLLGIQLGGNDWKAMQPLHCIKWGDMDHDLRRMMREKVLELLGLPPQVIESIEPESHAEQHSEPAKRLRLAFWRRAS